MAKLAAATNFESILDTPAEEVERPTPAPTGLYDFIVKGLPEYGESSKKKTPFTKFTLAFQAAGEDVGEEELTSWLSDKDGNPGALTERTIKLTFYNTPEALFRLTDFLEHCGVKAEGKTVRQMIDETPNASVRGIISHRASEDGQQIFAEISRTMKPE